MQRNPSQVLLRGLYSQHSWLGPSWADPLQRSSSKSVRQHAIPLVSCLPRPLFSPEADSENVNFSAKQGSDFIRNLQHLRELCSGSCFGCLKCLAGGFHTTQ
eukprot:1995495-Amphidinium_carterae.1